MKQLRFVGIGVILIYLFLVPMAAQESAVPGISWISQWHGAEAPVVELTLRTDLKVLSKERSAGSYQPATLQYVNHRGENTEADVKIRARGKTRRQICQLPPIKMKMRKSFLESQDLPPLNEVKIVWQCQNGKGFEQVLLKEYLIYRLYNVITPASFRVQLVQFSLYNTHTPDKQPIHRYGFLVEDDEELISRIPGELEETCTYASKLHSEAYLRYCLFQYMIGNTDWSFANGHNTCFIQSETDKLLCPVPYDFDYAGLVDASYAAPHPSIPIKDVTERYYKGFTSASEELLGVVCADFIAKKEALMTLVDDFAPLDKGNRTEMKKYLEEFFWILEDPQRIYRITHN
ncbi:MAG: hypothetical protein H6555_03665 [Lewinellaceae bacterium]|nr:hypothetical protein [Lewinellaceae bacterium]